MSNKEQYLDTILQKYRQGYMGREALEEKIFMYIRENPRHYFIGKYTVDSRDDFISWLYPRLSRAVDRYNDQGSSFDTFITTLIYLSAKEYGMRKKEHRITEKSWWDAKAQEMAVCKEEDTEYLNEIHTPAKVSNPRQVLILLLKTYYYIPDARLAQLAPALGLEKEELYRMVDELRVLRLQKEVTINDMKERIHGQFYRCLAFEKRLKSASPDSAHWYKMKRCVEISRKRLISMRKRIQTIRMEATNEEIARVLGIAKGTVDSNLYLIRQRNQTENQ
jgi:RNA polymerase sigma factor (sigma-70 family)